VLTKASGIQYAKANGLKVVAIDGGPDKEALCTRLGADVVIDFLQSKVSHKNPQLPFFE
jgi:D-arabinose 1-dehydrogenase-like Zn-dependent alcohol dehydrogenase